MFICRINNIESGLAVIKPQQFYNLIAAPRITASESPIKIDPAAPELAGTHRQIIFLTIINN